MWLWMRVSRLNWSVAVDCDFKVCLEEGALLEMYWDVAWGRWWAICITFSFDILVYIQYG